MGLPFCTYALSANESDPKCHWLEATSLSREEATSSEELLSLEAASLLEALEATTSEESLTLEAASPLEATSLACVCECHSSSAGMVPVRLFSYRFLCRSHRPRTERSWSWAFAV